MGTAVCSGVAVVVSFVDGTVRDHTSDWQILRILMTTWHTPTRFLSHQISAYTNGDTNLLPLQHRSPTSTPHRSADEHPRPASAAPTAAPKWITPTPVMEFGPPTMRLRTRFQSRHRTLYNHSFFIESEYCDPKAYGRTRVIRYG